MQIKLISIGRIKEKYLQKGIEMFIKRLQPFAHIKGYTIPESRLPKNQKVEFVMEKEALYIENVIKKEKDFIIALDIKGEKFSSESFAEGLEKWQQKGKNITFIIGGPRGLSPRILAQADVIMSLSAMTFTHQMVKLIFLEQLYRAFMINGNRPYHH